MYDLVIRNGKVVDGTGRAARTEDVAVKDGVIVAVGQALDAGRQEIAAAGLLVAELAAARGFLSGLGFASR